MQKLELHEVYRAQGSLAVLDFLDGWIKNLAQELNNER
jgi:hypothetical protein